MTSQGLNNYWLKQSSDKPLYPDLIWSRPENKAQAGKLLIIGGSTHSFAAVGEAYNQAVKAGIGTVRVLLPDALMKTVGKIFAVGEYAASTSSGSFARKSLDVMIELSSWADTTLLIGDFGRNSETAIVLEQLLNKYSGPIVITGDTLDYFLKNPLDLLNRPDTLLVVNLNQIQKMALATHQAIAFTSSIDLIRLVEGLHKLSQNLKAAIMLNLLNNVFATYKGQVSSTTHKISDDWQVKVAAKSSVWWIHNSTQLFKAITTSLI